MADATIICPHCQKSIELTEALAAPFIREAQERARAELKKGREALDREKEDLRLSRAAIDETIRERLESEKATLIEKLRAEAQSGVQEELDEVRVGREALEKKVVDGRKDRMELLRQLEEAKEAKESAREEAKKTLLAEREKLVRDAKEAASVEAKLELAARETVIEGLKSKIDELKKRAEQGSQQTQGEAQELVLEEALQDAFPSDVIEEVPKGANGADCLQKVAGPGGLEAGAIIWESKRTKNWSDSWIPKLKEDMERAAAGVAVLVSAVLPKEVRHFECVDGVWVTDFASAIPLAGALRQGVISVARERRSAEGLESKAGEVYEYVTGTAFRQRVQAMLGTYEEMAEDLRKEQAALSKQWAKRQKQLQKLWTGTAGVVGEIQGIAGRSALEIEAIELKALAAGPGAGDD